MYQNIRIIKTNFKNTVNLLVLFCLSVSRSDEGILCETGSFWDRIQGETDRGSVGQSRYRLRRACWKFGVSVAWGQGVPRLRCSVLWVAGHSHFGPLQTSQRENPNMHVFAEPTTTVQSSKTAVVSLDGGQRRAREWEWKDLEFSTKHAPASTWRGERENLHMKM